ncbi:MAG: NAD-dependent epimerase/dehydratase family protein [Planctomycetota bacterium]
MAEARSVLITGGAGFIGSHLAEAYLAEGRCVTVLDDLSTGSLRNIKHLMDSPRFRFELGSVMDPSLTDEMVRASDEVVHLAAAVGVKLVFSKPTETIERNVSGTEHVLRAALRYGRKVFVASTSEVYGKDPRGDGAASFSETDEITLGPSMRWCYACSKALDEYLARAYHADKGLPVVIGRLFNTVGPRQSGAYGMVIPRFVEWALAGKPIQVYGDGGQLRTFIHVLDAVRAVKGLMDEPAAEGEVVNIGSEETVSILDLARLVKEAADSSSEIVHVPYEEAFGEGFEDIRNRVPDVAKIRALTGFAAQRSLRDVLADTVEYARSGAARPSGRSGPAPGP